MNSTHVKKSKGYYERDQLWDSCTEGITPKGSAVGQLYQGCVLTLNFVMLNSPCFVAGWEVQKATEIVTLPIHVNVCTHSQTSQLTTLCL